MAKPAVNLKKIAEEIKIPNGRYRARIISVAEYPKDTTLGDRGEIPGVLNDKGEQKYGWMRVGFRFIEHPSNYVPGSDGEAISLVGDSIFENYTYHPHKYCKQQLLSLYGNTGTDLDAPMEELLQKELDIEVEQKPRSDDANIPEARVVRTRVAVG